MRYLSDIRDQVHAHLIDKVGTDFEVQKFYSENVNELTDTVLDNHPHIDDYPHLFVAVPRVDTSERYSVPTDLLDSVEVRVWVVSADSNDEGRSYYNADEAAALTRAFLSRPRFGTTFTSEESLENLSISEEVVYEDIAIYSVTGTLQLDIDNQVIIDNYTP